MAVMPLGRLWWNKHTLNYVIEIPLATAGFFVATFALFKNMITFALDLNARKLNQTL